MFSEEEEYFEEEEQAGGMVKICMPSPFDLFNFYTPSLERASQFTFLEIGMQALAHIPP
jgi:hypothetical protein